MSGRIIIVLLLVGSLVSCDSKKVEVSQHTLDSLRNQLAINREMNKTLEEIGTLIDSIDANRNMLRTRMLEGATYESYVARMRDINEHVKKTQAKMEALQKMAKKSNDKALKAVIKQLKADIETRNHELAAMKEQVDFYQKENESLTSMVGTQKSEIEKQLADLRVREEKTVELEKQVSDLLVQSKSDHGEALFAQAMAVEETARRTHFAPKKKRNTRMQALELYRMALTYGKEEAREKIAMLETKR